VVGAGPAGLACAGELAADGVDVTVFDEHHEVGGTVRTAIAPYRQLVEPLPAERKALEQLGVRFVLGKHVGTRSEFAAATGKADAVFMAVGLGEDRPLDCPGIDLPGFWPSLLFIAELKHNRQLELGRHVIVLGGGNTAIDVAREAVRLGAPHVTLAYRRTRSEMPAYGFEVDEAEAEGVHFEWLASPVMLNGAHHVEWVTFERMELGEPGEDGRRSIAPVPGRDFELPANTVVAALGQTPRREPSLWDGAFALDHGRIAVDPATGATRTPFVYAGGDAINGGSSVVQAVAEGKRAARAIEEALCLS
jgi:glutamate synthase (NADPH/NADH) small chain